MTTALTALTIVLGILLVVTEFILIFKLASYLVYGGFIQKEKEEFFMNIPDDKYRLNYLDSSILQLHYGYISTTPFSILSKYHINSVGKVYRWSKLSKKIDEYYEIAFKKEFQGKYN